MEHPFFFIVAILVSNLILIYAYRLMIISVGHKQNLRWYLFWGYFSAFKIIPKYIRLLRDSYGEQSFNKNFLYLIFFLVGLLSLIIEVYFFVFRYLLIP
jgi:hypothetical protein